MLESQACYSFPTVFLVIFVGRAPGLGRHLLAWQGSALASQGDTGVVLRGRYRGMVAGVTKFHRYWAPPLLAGCSPGPALGRVNQVLATSLCTRGKDAPHTTLLQIALRSPDQTNLSGILIRSLCSVSLPAALSHPTSTHHYLFYELSNHALVPHLSTAPHYGRSLIRTTSGVAH